MREARRQDGHDEADADARGPPRQVAARIDLHVHSAFSRDGIGTLDQIAAVARSKGLNGVCLTEHDTLQHRSRIDVWNRDHASPARAPDGGSFRFYVGCEVSSRGGHVLAIGLQEEVPYGRSPAETIELVQDQGAIAVPAHPYRRGSGIGEDAALMLTQQHPGLVAAIEVHNAQETSVRNDRAKTLAERMDVGGTGGSDAHQVTDVGNAHTAFPRPVDGLDDLVGQLRQGITWGDGGRTSLPTLMRQGARVLARRATGRLRYPRFD